MKILIVTKNWLGDVLFQMPAIELIRKNNPNAIIACVAPKRCHEILKAHPAVDEVLLFDEKGEHRSWWKRLSFVFSLRRGAWDRAYFMHRSRTRAFLFWLGGVQERIGFEGKSGAFLTKTIPNPKTQLHQVDYFLELLKGDGMKPPMESRYRFYDSETDRQSVARFLVDHQLDTFVCFHLGANWSPKRWPTAHFAKLADLLFEKWGLSVVLTGGPGDEALAEEVMREAKRAKIISVAGQTKLGELGALYRHAKFVVSGDSGPMHIASGVGTRTVALFGPTDPKLTGPRGVGEVILLSYVPKGCHTPCYDEAEKPGEWLSHIQPHEVMEAIHGRFWIQPSASDESQSKDTAKADQKKTFSKASVQKILVITLTNIGDVILNTAVIMALVWEFPKAQITVVTGPKGEHLLRESRFIHRLVIYDKRASWRQKWKFLKEVRQDRYDWVVDLKNTAIPYLVRAKKRSSLFRPHREVLLRARHLEVLQMMGLEVNPRTPFFDFYNDQDEVSILRKIQSKGIQAKDGWILLAPIAGNELKTWKLEGFRQVMEKLLQENGEDIFLIGGDRERSMIESLCEVNPSRVRNLAGMTTLRELAFLIDKSSLLLSNDSSAMHMGFELRARVVAIFGPTNPAKAAQKGPTFRVVTNPIFCVPCDKPRCRFERRACLDDLTSQKVLQACQELLHASQVA